MVVTPFSLFVGLVLIRFNDSLIVRARKIGVE
ncbi:MAG: hypothetical protein ACJAX5_003482 [Patiriisocius sp.]